MASLFARLVRQRGLQQGFSSLAHRGKTCTWDSLLHAAPRPGITLNQQRHQASAATATATATAAAQSSPVEAKVVDLRSDTFTKPTPGMRKAIAEAVVGDDVYKEDPTVNELQRRCADLFGMEAALYVPTGTMGNLIAILVHCNERCREAIVGHKSHILLNETGGISQFAGVMPRTITNNADGTFDLEEMEKMIRPLDDPHQPWTRLICLENSHNFCGGKALPLDFVKEVYRIARANNLVVHTDGARILNSAAAVGVAPADLLQYSDSVGLCFSKGLGAPVGSILAGSKKFIDEALRMRKGLGGGMRQAGILAAAAIYALDTFLPRLHEDHEHAKMITDTINRANKGVVHINDSGINTNIITIDIIKPGLTAAQFCQRMGQVTEEERAALGDSVVVKMGAIFPQVARILTHNDISPEMIDLATSKLAYVVREFGQS